MIGGWARNVVMTLLLLLWIYVAAALNAGFLAHFSWYRNVEQVRYYLLPPALVIIPGVIGLAYRWRWPFSGLDALLLVWPIIMLPLYLLPFQ